MRTRWDLVRHRADRGLALIFVVTGILGLVATLLALRSRSYRRLSRAFAQPREPPAPDDQPSAPVVAT